MLKLHRIKQVLSTSMTTVVFYVEIATNKTSFRIILLINTEAAVFFH